MTGYCQGEICGRNGCIGIVKEYSVENCSCHIHPPCGACTKPRGYCSMCDWQEADDYRINDYVVNVDRTTGIHKYSELRKLDAKKIDWYSKSHSNASMIKEGVYPVGVSQEEVRQKVDGTFGGRFDYFGNGKFKFIAYTD